MQQWRLFPYLAAACVLKVSVTSLTDVYLAIIEKSRANSNGFEELVCDILSKIRYFYRTSFRIMIFNAFKDQKGVGDSCIDIEFKGSTDVDCTRRYSRG